MGNMLIAPVADATERVRADTFIHAHTGSSPEVDRRIAVTDIVTKDASGNVGPLSIVSTQGFVAPTLLASDNIASFRVVFNPSLYAGVPANKAWLHSYTDIYYGSDASIKQTFISAGVAKFIIEASGSVRAGLSNAQDLGSASVPWRNGFIQNGWTVTSDADLKQRGAVLSAAEITAGKRIAEKLCWWKLLDSIATKGAAARNHFGPMAQDIAQILVECGVELDWTNGNPSFRSDMLCWDQWDEVTKPVMATRTVPKTKIVFVPVEGSDDGSGQPFYQREEITVDEVEEYDSGEVTIETPAGSGWRIDPSQVAFFLIAAIKADTERRLALLEAGES